MVDPGVADPQACEPCPALQPCDVYGSLSIRILRRKKALHHLQFGKPFLNVLTCVVNNT